MGKNGNGYTAEECISVTEGSMGVVSVIARRLGCSRQYVYKLMDKFVTFRQAVDQERDNTRDLARVRLFEHINRGSLKAITYYLDRTDPEFRPKSQQEVSGPGGGDITVKIIKGVSFDDL